MSSRSSARRSTASAAPTSSRLSRSRVSIGVVEPDLAETEDEEDDEDDEDGGNGTDLTPEPGPSRAVSSPSRRGRGRPRGSRGRGRGGGPGRSRTGTATADEDPDEAGKSLRLRKSVSYAEVAEPEVEEEDEEEDDEDGEGDEEDAEPEVEETALGTPRRRLRASEQPAAASPSGREIERVGSGRGGFSVKGAAAAAARARWAKYRSEKADESDDGERRPKARGGASAAAAARKDTRAAADTPAEGTVLRIKGKDYTVGDDEIILDNDPKGDLKVDAMGNILGGREYRLVTFTSVSRSNPNRIYALTIDAARACGYTDSLAFLRRCPQILKLPCTADERQMLIDIGRVTGNLKNRMVTMVSMRNVYKMMGARVIKNGKWVTDDYYEDKAMADCVENGFTPFAIVHDDEIMSNAMANTAPQGRQGGYNTRDNDGGVSRAVLSLAPTYTLGGPTTHFAGSGADPWSEAGWGNKRQKLKSLGVSEEDWMYRTAVETRAVDEQLREYRDDKLGRLEGADLKVWVWGMERVAEGEEDSGQGQSGAGGEVVEEKKDREPTAEWLKPPVPERRRSGLSQEVLPEEAEGEGATAIRESGEDVEMPDTAAAVDTQAAPAPAPAAQPRKEGAIVVQTAAEEAEYLAKRVWGGNWEAGVVRAVIEPHTHIPHVPQYTQPLSCTTSRLSHNPLIASIPDKSYTHHIQSSISGRGAKGLSSVEFVFENGDDVNLEHERRLEMVRDAEEWERDMKRRKTAV